MTAPPEPTRPAGIDPGPSRQARLDDGSSRKAGIDDGPRRQAGPNGTGFSSGWTRRQRLVGFRGKVILSFLLVALTAAVAGAVLTWVGLAYVSYFGGGLSPLGPLLSATEWFVLPIYRALGPDRFIWTVVLTTILVLIGIVILLALLATTKVMRSVGQVSAAARQLADGDFGTRLAVRGKDELADLQDDFNRMAAALQDRVGRLQEMETQSRRFAADVSHELRTPLSTMTAVVDILEDDSRGLSADAAQAARLISTETRSLVRLVDDLVEISRFDAHTAALQLDDVDLGAAIATTLHSRGWTDQVGCELTVGLMVRVDQRRLDVILANLIGNALRHGKPPVLIRARPVFEFARLWLVIEVLDHGSGLPEEAVERVFDRFWKADTARTRSEGSGLGLAIARENARLHGGSLRVRNALPVGACFTLRLPLD